MAAEPIDPAVAALARVRAAVRSQPRRRRAQPPQLSGSAPDTRDPQPLGRGIDEWVGSGGYRAELAAGGLVGRWEQIVGEQVAAHVTVKEFVPGDTGGTVVLTADSPQWAVQMKYLLPQIRRRIDEELGAGVVTDLRIVGPTAPRSRGRLRVRTGRRSPR